MLFVGVIHFAQIVSSQQWRGQHRPQAHMRRVSHRGVMWPLPTSSMSGSFQCPGAAYFESPACANPIDRHAIVAVVDVAGCAPQIPADLRSPVPHRVKPVLAQAEYDWPMCVQQCLVHFLVGRVHHLPLLLLDHWELLSRMMPPIAAQVILQIIDAPFCIGSRILLLVPIAAWIAARRFSARAKNKFPASVPSSGHNPPALSCQEISVGWIFPCASRWSFPGVVDVHVNIAGIAHAARNHAVRGGANVRVRHLAGK